MLEIAIDLITITHVVVSLLMILVILMQRPKQEGLGAAFGSGMTDAAWGARTTDVLQKGTVYLGTLFFLLSLTLGILTGRLNAIKGKDYASDGATKVEKPEEFDNSQESLNLDLEGNQPDLPIDESAGSGGDPDGGATTPASDEADPTSSDDATTTPEEPESSEEPEATGESTAEETTEPGEPDSGDSPAPPAGE